MNPTHLFCLITCRHGLLLVHISSIFVRFDGHGIYSACTPTVVVNRHDFETCNDILYTLVILTLQWLLTYSMEQSSSWEAKRFQLVKKFTKIYGTRRFITAFTRARHLSLSPATLILSINPHPTSWISILILSSHLRLGLPRGLLPLGFPTKSCILLFCPSTRYMPRPSHSSRFYHSNNFG